MTKKSISGSKTKTSEKNFEKSLQRLEEIVDNMENADPDLDKALALFTEGIELVRFCSSKLSDAKKQVEILIKENGQIKKEKFKNEREED